jgi:Na+-transporting methylmalonyl-CoA/oxaloacetate decarboxylase beta subunit
MNRQTVKRVIAIALLGAMVLGLLPLAALASSVGVIGGADGPTAIFVTGSRGGILSTLLLIAGGICGILAVVKILQKRRK